MPQKTICQPFIFQGV